MKRLVLFIVFLSPLLFLSGCSFYDISNPWFMIIIIIRNLFLIALATVLVNLFAYYVLGVREPPPPRHGGISKVQKPEPPEDYFDQGEPPWTSEI